MISFSAGSRQLADAALAGAGDGVCDLLQPGGYARAARYAEG
jgi:hypothetical protein